MNGETINLEDELLVDFLDESSQLLDRLNENLLIVDEWASENAGSPAARLDEEMLNDMFRAAHSIKGLSGMLGLSCINSLIHKVENLFDAARKGELSVDPPVVEVLFLSIDQVTAMVNRLRTEGTDEVEDNGIAEQIKQLLQQSGCERAATNQQDAEAALAAQLAELSADVSQCIEPNSPSPIAETTMPSASNLSQPEPSQPTAASPESAVEDDSAAILLQNFVDQFEQATDENEVPAKYMSIFIDETEMSLDTLTESLLAEDAATSTQTVENTLIVAHRIKGSAASVGLNRPARLAHLMEDVLQELREQKGRLWPEMIDAMLSCSDALRGYVAGLKLGEPVSDGFAKCAYDLMCAQQQFYNPAESVEVVPTAATESQPESSPAPTPQTAPQLDANLLSLMLEMAPAEQAVYQGQVSLEPGLPLAGLKAQLILEKLISLGELLHSVPPAAGIDELEVVEHLSFIVSTQTSVELVRSRLNIAGVQHLELTTLQPASDATSAVASAKVTPVAAPPATATPQQVETPATPIAQAPAATPATAPAPPATPAPSTAASQRPRQPDTTQKATETLRVDIERLDQLMNLAGQLVINKARFSQIGEGLKGSLPSKQTAQMIANAVGLVSRILNSAEGDGQRNSPLDAVAIRSHARRLKSDLDIVSREVTHLTQVRTSVNELFEAVHQLDRVTDGIQKTVMDTRMVPIGPLFSRFKRVIRDITRANGKTIQLAINGEKTELDKRMIDELGDPLIHMVRNSADHGIESPEERAAAGKPAQGTVTLDACHRGNSIVIQIRDDGKGLDRDRILQKAIERKLITPADGERMSNSQIYQLIWEPGFSTAEKVTEISGRGMGMDIVRSKIEELNGQVEVDSEPGQGSVFRIKLPLTLAILPSLMAEIDGDVFALPVESIVEIVSVEKEDFSTVHGKATATVRGRVVSVVQLSEIFSWHSPSNIVPHASSQDRTLVVLGLDGREIGLAVDGLLGEEDIVIKSLAENYQHIAGIAGASILGNGRVSLILDPSTLIDMSSRADAAAVTA